MGDVDDPVALAQDYWTLTKLWHAVDALYMWEFFSTLDYEWSVIRRRRPYRWTIWIYSLTRVATLLAAIYNLIGLNATTSINCQAWVVFNFSFAYLALACSSLLVVFRIIAIWNKDKHAVALAISVWGANVLFLLHGKSLFTHRRYETQINITRYQIRSEWTSDQRSCVVLNPESNKLTIIIMFVTDLILLATMFVGLLRLRRRGGGTFELGRLLWKQGVIWLLLGTTAELTPVVFMCMYLNDALNIMFLVLSLLTMSIAATRMYRSLADFLESDIVPKRDRITQSTMWSSAVPTSSDQMAMNVNVNVQMTYPSEPYLIPQPARYISFIDMDADGHSSLRDQLREPSFDDDLARGLTVKPPFRTYTL